MRINEEDLAQDQGIFEYDMSSFLKKVRNRFRNEGSGAATSSGSDGNEYDKQDDDVSMIIKRMMQQSEDLKLQKEQQQQKAQAAPKSTQPLTKRSLQKPIQPIIKPKQEISKETEQSNEEGDFQIKEGTELKIPQEMSVRQFSVLSQIPARKIMGILAEYGERLSSESETINADQMEIVATEVGYKVGKDMSQFKNITYERRAPIVTIMGHVDHGKTSLLDALRNTKVTEQEFGGITQHIGAFQVSLKDFISQNQTYDANDKITFLDTPGHSAFSSMRQRGAQVTDIGVVVVAVDDGVMPQTQEAIRIAQESNIAIIVAITKCDKEDLLSRIPQVKQQLKDEGLQLEEDGGPVQVITTSARTREGLDDLVQAIVLQGEVMNLNAGRNLPCTAKVIETNFDKAVGNLASVIVTQGELKVGDNVVVGDLSGRIRGLRMAQQGIVRSALPGQPVEVIGLRGIVDVGEQLQVVKSQEIGQKLASAKKTRKAREVLKEQELSGQQQAQDQSQTAQQSLTKGLSIVDNRKFIPQRGLVEYIIIADVKGTMEALISALKQMANPYVEINIIKQGFQSLKLEDIVIAQNGGVKILAFNCQNITPQMLEQAEQADVKVKQFNIIYDLLNEIGEDMLGCAPRIIKENVVGQAIINREIPISGRQSWRVAGSRAFEGKIIKNEDMTVRIKRMGVTVFQGPIRSLKHFKDDVNMVEKGQEFGMTFLGFDGWDIGDTIECVEKVEDQIVPVPMTQGGFTLKLKSEI